MRPLVALALLLAGPLLFGGSIPLTDGESFSYSLYLVQGFIPIPAGLATLSVAATNHQGQAAYALGLALDASPVVEKLYHVRTRLRSFVTPAFDPLRYEKNAEEGKRFYTETTTFTRLEDGACSVSCRRAFKDGRVDTGREVRPGPVYDLVSVCFFARGLSRSLPLGERLPLAVVSGVKVRDRTLVYKGTDNAKGQDGISVPCDVFVLGGTGSVPSVGGTGSVPSSEIARFWISRDARRVPVRIDLALKFGSVSVRLD